MRADSMVGACDPAPPSLMHEIMQSSLPAMFLQHFWEQDSDEKVFLVFLEWETGEKILAKASILLFVYLTMIISVRGMDFVNMELSTATDIYRSEINQQV